MNLKSFILLTIAFVFFAGCASSITEQPTREEQIKNNKQLLDESNNVTISNSILQKKIKKTSIYVYPNEKLSAVLKKLSNLEHEYYFLKDKDIEIKGNKVFKVSSFNELNNYLSALTNHKMIITENKFKKNLPKTIKLQEIIQSSILDKITFSSNGLQIPSHIFSNLSTYAQGWKIIDYADVKKIFNKKQYSSFNGTLREFIEYFAQNNDIFVNFDYEKKKIIFKKFQTKHFPINIVLEKYKFKNNLVIDVDKSSSDTSTNNGKGSIVVENEYDALKSLSSLLSNIIKKDSKDEYWDFLTTTNKLVVKTTPRKLKTIEKVVNNINESALKQIFLKVSVYQIDLNKQSQYGVNWGYINDVVDSTGNVLKNTIGSTSSIVNAVDKTLTSPTIFKMSGDGFNTAVKLMNQFGKATLNNQMPLVTTNNIPTIYSLADRTGYISNYTLETTANVGSNIAIEQAKAISGQYVYMKPTIFNDEILVSLKMILSRVKNIEKQEFTNGQYIQTPNDSRNVISQNIVLKSGEKIIIGGIIERTTEDDYKGLSPYNNNWSALAGDKNKMLRNKEVVIVIEAKQL